MKHLGTCGQHFEGFRLLWLTRLSPYIPMENSLKPSKALEC